MLKVGGAYGPLPDVGVGFYAGKGRVMAACLHYRFDPDKGKAIAMSWIERGSGRQSDLSELRCIVPKLRLDAKPNPKPEDFPKKMCLLEVLIGKEAKFLKTI